MKLTVLKFNQYLFGALLYGFGTAFIATGFYIIFVLVFPLFLFGTMDLPMAIGSGVYVFMCSILVCFILCLIALLFRHRFPELKLKNESYFLTGLSAIFVNIIALYILGWQFFTWINFAIYGASFLTIYVGSKLYIWVIKRLTELSV